MCLGSDRLAEEAGHALFSGTLNITPQKDKEKVIKLCISPCCKRCFISKASAMKRAMLKEPHAQVCLGAHVYLSYHFLGNVGHSWNRLVSAPQPSIKHLHLRPHSNYCSRNSFFFSPTSSYSGKSVGFLLSTPIFRNSFKLSLAVN